MALHSQRNRFVRAAVVVSVAAVFGSMPLWGALGATAQVAEIKADTNSRLQTIKVSPYVTVDSETRDAYTVMEVTAVDWPTYQSRTVHSDGFGARGGEHEGVDFLPGVGTPVVSIAKGTVVRTGILWSYGYSVDIMHNINGVQTMSRYAHMIAGSLKVSPGETVSLGTVIGSVGSTGRSTGPHLHFEIRINGTAIDPLAWLYAHVNAGAWDWMLDK